MYQDFISDLNEINEFPCKYRTFHCDVLFFLTTSIHVSGYSNRHLASKYMRPLQQHIQLVQLNTLDTVFYVPDCTYKNPDDGL